MAKGKTSKAAKRRASAKAKQRPALWTSLRPTARAAVLFAFSVPLALVAVTGFREFWYVSLYWPVFAVALLLADLAAMLPGRAVTVTPQVPQRLYIGDRGEVSVTFSDYSRNRPTPVGLLLEQEGDAEPPVIHNAVLPPRSGKTPSGQDSATVMLPLVPRRRGRITVRALWLRWRGPLGLMEVRRRDQMDAAVDVAPNVRGIHEAALQFFARDAIYGVKTQRMRGQGTEFETLREYAQGMDSRFIDWKRSARHRKMLCKEFREERNHQIVLGFDTGHLMLEPVNGVPKLDHAVRAALLLSWISLYGGDLVGGCGFDARFRHFLKPRAGMPYFAQFQKFTAELDYHPEETNFTLGLADLNSRLNRRALVVLFTEFVDTISAELLLESLQILSRKHVVVFVTMRDPMLSRVQESAPDDFTTAAQAVVADGFLRERAVVLEKVARLGVHCVDAPAHAISPQLINRYLMIKQRGLL